MTDRCAWKNRRRMPIIPTILFVSTGAKALSEFHVLRVQKMDKRLIGLSLVLKRLGIESIDSLEKRTVMQKKIYIAQSMGMNLGYSFQWHIHGPYSKELTEDCLLLI